METENKKQETSTTDKSGVSFNPLLAGSFKAPFKRVRGAMVLRYEYREGKQREDYIKQLYKEGKYYCEDCHKLFTGQTEKEMRVALWHLCCDACYRELRRKQREEEEENNPNYGMEYCYDSPSDADMGL